MLEKPVHGVVPAVATAHSKTIQKILIDQLLPHSDGMLYLGTTGQDVAFSPKEHVKFAKESYDYTRSQGFDGPILIGAGSNVTEEAISLHKAILEAIDGKVIFLDVTGYKNNPPQGGLYRHFEKLNNAINAPIILYSVSGRTGSRLEPETVIALSKLDNIMGIKWAETVGDPLADVKKIVEGTPDDFVVMSGNDDLYAGVLQRGGDGVISASASVAPNLFCKIRDNPTAQTQEYANDFIKLGVFAKGTKNPMGVNYMLFAELPNAGLKLPLFSISEENEINDPVTGFKEDYSAQRKQIAIVMKKHYDDLIPMAQNAFDKVIHKYL